LYLSFNLVVDLIEVSPLVGLGVRDFTVGRTALKAVSSKMTKHTTSISANGGGSKRYLAAV
jgi:hypothetical protein